MNITQDKQGKWRAIHGDELYWNKLVNGLKYRSHLASNLMNLGLELELKAKGLFEIKEVDRGLIDFYSKRRAEIEACLQELGQTGGKAAAMANFMTRPPKDSGDPEQRQARWLGELQAFGSSVTELKRIMDKAKERGPLPLPDPSLIASLALQSAVNHLTEKKRSFSFQEVIKTAKTLSLLSTNEGELLEAIEREIANGHLIYLENKCLTTAQLKGLEKSNIERMQLGKGSAPKILPRWVASLYTAFKTQDLKERQALIALLASRDRQLLLHSNSKDLLFQTLKNYIEVTKQQYFYPRVLTQKNLSVEPLSARLGTTRVSTIEGFLLACEKRAEERGEPKHLLETWNRGIKKQAARDIWIIEGEASHRQLNNLGHFAEIFGARLVFATLKPVAALEPLREKGLTEILLKADKQVITQFRSRTQLLKTIDYLDKNHCVQQEPEREKRLHFAIEQYVNLPTSNKQLITLNYLERNRLNTGVREQLKQRGVLKGPSQTLNSLRPLNMSQEEKSLAHCYQPGDILRFNRDLPQFQIQKNSYFEVVKVDLENAWVELRSKDSQILWDPLKSRAFLKQVEVFKPQEREIQAGEWLSWTRNLKEEASSSLHRIKGQTAKVLTVQKDKCLVQLANGEALQLEPQAFKNQHWDYGYSLHLAEVALKAPQEIILVLDHKQLTPKNISLLTECLETVQQNKGKLRLICNDLVDLKKTILSPRHEDLEQDNREAPYQRAQALESYQTLATQPLFNRLQKACLKITEQNPEFRKLVIPSLASTVELTPEFKLTCNLIDKLIIYHSERDAVFKREDLNQHLRELLIARDLPTSEAIELALQQGWLMIVGEDEQKQTLLTAKHTWLMEQACIEKMKAGKNQLTPILAKDSLYLEEIRNHPCLTQGQKEAIELVLTTQDRMVAVQGIAGTGKTTALREIDRLCEQAHFRTLVLANTGSAKNQAKKAAGVPALTIAQFLTRVEPVLKKDFDKAKRDWGGNQLFIVDESSLVSTKDSFRLEKVIEKLGVHLEWMGDFKQQGSIGSGLNFQAHLAYGIQKATMQENVRLSCPTAFMAMKHAYAGNMTASLKTLYDVQEVPNKQEALVYLAGLYCDLHDSPTLKSPPLVIIPLNKDRIYVNEEIRTLLKKQGKLPKAGELFRGKQYLDCALNLSLFVPLSSRREIDKSDITTYQLSDIIRFNTYYPRLNLAPGDYARLLEIDVRHERLTLKIPGKQECYWSPKNLKQPSDIELYHEETREIGENDLIVFTKNQETKGIFNGDTARITRLEKGIAEVLLSDGQTLQLDLTQPQNRHFDHGYALTVYGAQGKEAELILAYGEGPRPHWRKASQLKVGDTVVLPKDLQEKSEDHYVFSKLVEVINIKKKSAEIKTQEGKGKSKSYKGAEVMLTLQDKRGEVHTVNVTELKPGQKIKRHLSTRYNMNWAYFPPFENRKSEELPKVTSQQAFLVQITRGDGLLLMVPHIEDFRKTLEAHRQLKSSALSYLDPNWQKLNEAVNRLVANIQGKAEEKLENNPLKLNENSPNLSPSLKSKDKGEEKQKHLASKSNKKTHSSSYTRPKTKTAFKERESSFIDKEALESRLSGNLLGYASRWLGRPNTLSQGEARWRKNTSFSLVLSGTKEGVWCDWESGRKGKGLISLYMEVHNVSFKEALKELAWDCGLARTRQFDKTPSQAKIDSVKPKETPEQERQRKIKDTLELYQTAVPILGTLAEKYLREHRGIVGELPKDFRFLKMDWHFQTKKYLPALVAPYRDKENQIIGAVRIYLNPDGSKYRDTFKDGRGEEVAASPKLNKGISAFGGVVVQEAILPQTLWIAEGVETALSVAKAVPHQTVMASLSAQQIVNTPLPPETQAVVICADNDPASSHTKASIIKAVDSFLVQGLKVFIALPPPIPLSMKKYDFNDLLKDQGLGAVEACLEQRLEIKDARLFNAHEPRLEPDLKSIRETGQGIENKHFVRSHGFKELAMEQKEFAISVEKNRDKGIER